MRAVRGRLVAAVVVTLVLVLAGIAVWRGVTEPRGSIFSLSNRHADVIGCWVLFLGLPLGCVIDALRIDGPRWWSADRSQAAWIAVVAFAPAVGPLLYAAIGRPGAQPA
jgi:hypothetical protein